MFGIASTELHDVGAQSAITDGYMMLEHKVPSLMAGMTEEKVSTALPTTTKPLVKPSQANENCSAIPVENGAPHLNGNVSNGVH